MESQLRWKSGRRFQQLRHSNHNQLRYIDAIGGPSDFEPSQVGDRRVVGTVTWSSDKGQRRSVVRAAPRLATARGEELRGNCKPARRPLPEHLRASASLSVTLGVPVLRRRIAQGRGGRDRDVGTDPAPMESDPACGEKFLCRTCEAITQPAAPSHGARNRFYERKVTIVFAGYNTPQPRNHLGDYASIGQMVSGLWCVVAGEND